MVRTAPCTTAGGIIGVAYRNARAVLVALVPSPRAAHCQDSPHLSGGQAIVSQGVKVNQEAGQVRMVGYVLFPYGRDAPPRKVVPSL